MANPSTIDEYIAGFPKEIQQILTEIRATVHAAVPGPTETISYAIPTFKFKGKNLVHFAAFKNHIGFYATPDGHEAFAADFARYKTGKGSVQFPISEPMPLKLIAKVVKFRVTEMQ